MAVVLKSQVFLDVSLGFVSLLTTVIVSSGSVFTLRIMQ
jgi:hypothetical protein